VLGGRVVGQGAGVPGQDLAAQVGHGGDDPRIGTLGVTRGAIK
jgi:hypothetical protein